MTISLGCQSTLDVSNLIAARFKFEPRDFFELEAPAAERTPVKVSF